MIHDYRLSNLNSSSLPPGELYDADTGEHLPNVYMYDDETGEYWYYVTDANSKYKLTADGKHVVTGYGKLQRLKFIPFDENGKADFALDADAPIIVE